MQCKKCVHRAHLACSELPPYQIQLYLQHKSRNYQLKKKLNFKPVGELQKDIEACENIIKAQREEIVNLKAEVSTNNVNKAVAEIENTFNKRIDVLEGKINKIANKKQPSSINEAACGKSSYSEIMKKHLELQTKTIKRFIEKEKTDKKWIEATSCNLMIHHLYETTEDTKEIADKNDIEYIEEHVISKLNIGEIKFVKSERIGTLTLEKEEKEQYRPLKLTFQSEEDKEKVLKGICNSDRLLL